MLAKFEITAIILAKNEASMIGACLNCLNWCKDILVIDTGSVDKTVEIAESLGARVISFKHSSFAKVRTQALKYVNTPWLIYIDADERVTPQLAEEIQSKLNLPSISALQLRRDNYFYGKKMTKGGWEKDLIVRVFLKNALKSYNGEIHEHPEFEGQAILLKSPLIHLSHRSTKEGLIKSADWTYTEAKLLVDAGINKVGIWTLLKKGLGEFYRRYFKNRGYQDGATGMIESMVQAINRILVYIQVWELQQKPEIKDLYNVKEREIELLWRDDQI